MKKRLQELVAGVLIGATITGGMVFAKSGTETLQVLYNNIKIYVDGIKINPKDANGTKVEPFIYNGTTYLPVRAIGNALGKEVSWDGNTNTVYIGKSPQQTSFLTIACPSYEFDKYNYKEYTIENGESFSMGGIQYTNGFYASASTNLNNAHNVAYYNLNSKYKKMSFIAGAVDNKLTNDAEIRIYADGKSVKSIDISSDISPKEYSVSLDYALQLKIEMVSSKKGYNIGKVGLANIVLE